MAGMDMMFSSLVGMKPAEMKEAVSRTFAMAEAAAKDMAEIRASQIRTEETMNEILEFIKGENTNGRGSGKQLNGNSDSIHV